jgi:hypothetical protein
MPPMPEKREPEVGIQLAFLAAMMYPFQSRYPHVRQRAVIRWAMPFDRSPLRQYALPVEYAPWSSGSP